MKKLLFLFLLLPLLFLSCSGDDDEVYTSDQKKAFSILRGTWIWDKGGSLEETIIFEKNYDKIRDFSQKDPIKGDTYNFSAMGECVYKKNYYKDIRPFNCYYYLSRDLTSLRFYEKETEVQIESFSISIKSESEIELRHKDPHHLGQKFKIFIKQ